MAIKRIVPAVLLLALLPACGKPVMTAYADVSGLRGVSAQAAPGQLIVRFKNQARQALLQKLGLRTIKKVNRLDALVVTAPNVDQAIAALRADKEVAFAEPNFVARAIEAAPMPGVTFGVDERLKDLWGMAKIEAPAVWG